MPHQAVRFFVWAMSFIFSRVTSGSRNSSAFLLRKSAAAVKDTLIAQKTGFADRRWLLPLMTQH
jgi:hypothetical protein